MVYLHQGIVVYSPKNNDICVFIHLKVIHDILLKSFLMLNT